MNLHPLRAFPGFYLRAQTQYQVHSPFVYELVRAVLEDRRRYYAFDDIEALRRRLLEGNERVVYDDPGARGGTQERRLSDLARTSASSPRQGRRLFRLAQWLKPARMVELGTSLGFGAAYLAAGGAPAVLDTLEGAKPLARIAAVNLDWLKLHNARVHAGRFDDVLPAVLQAGPPPGLIFFDGNHRADATLAYFETCMAHGTDKTLYVFDDLDWSAGMAAFRKRLQEDPRVRLMLDLWDFTVVSTDPAFKEKQHLRLVPAWWKPWKSW
jgi:predicted O-methyltransferase YrrM